MDIERGDIVKFNKPLSPVSRFDCVVGCVDPAFMILFSLPDFANLFIMRGLEDFKYLSVIKKGRGVLESEQKEILEKAVGAWPYKKFFSSLGETVASICQATHFTSDKKCYVRVAGFVPEPLAIQWRQLLAMADIYKQVSPNAPDTEVALLQWMLIASLGMVQTYEDLKQRLDGN